jgi:hypothetical protein
MGCCFGKSNNDYQSQMIREPFNVDYREKMYIPYEVPPQPQIVEQSKGDVYYYYK